MQKHLRRIFQPRYLLWLANLVLGLPWIAIAALMLLGRLNQEPDPMPALLLLVLIFGMAVMVVGMVAIALGLFLGLVAIVWASRTQRLRKMTWAMAIWGFLLVSWLGFGLVLLR